MAPSSIPRPGSTARATSRWRTALIARIAPDIAATEAARTIDAGGRIVTPGLIDLHAHVFEGVDRMGVNPDLGGVLRRRHHHRGRGQRGGGHLRRPSRATSFPQCHTEVIPFLHICQTGLATMPDIIAGAAASTSTTRSASCDQHKGLIRGIKARMVSPALEIMGMEMPRLARRAARESGIKLMVHIGDTEKRYDPEVIRSLLPLLDEGDILTHYFTANPGGVLDANGKLVPEAREAADRGVWLDTAHGRMNFSFDVGRRIIEQGLLPHCISTDLTVPGRLDDRAQHDRDDDALPRARLHAAAGRDDVHGQPRQGHRRRRTGWAAWPSAARPTSRCSSCATGDWVVYDVLGREPAGRPGGGAVRDGQARPGLHARLGPAALGLGAGSRTPGRRSRRRLLLSQRGGGGDRMTELHVNLMDPEFVADPYPTYHRLRAEDPVHRSPLGFWVLTRYEDVVASLRDPRFAKEAIAAYVAARFGIAPPGVGLSMLDRDPPDHTRLRGLVSKAFTPRVVDGLRPHIQEIVDGLLDQARDRGAMDLIEDFAYMLPVRVICEMLGVPVEDRERFKDGAWPSPGAWTPCCCRQTRT